MTNLAARVQTRLHILRQRWDDGERGATAVEYGLMVALIAAVIIVAVRTIGTDTNAAFQKVADNLPNP